MITLTIEGKKIECKSGICGNEIASNFKENPFPLMAIFVNNEINSLTSRIDVNAEIKPVYLNTKDGALIYRRSLCFILAAASHALFPEKRLLIGHSLGSSYYYTFDGKSVTEKEIAMLKDKMNGIISKNETIKTQVVSYADACRLFERQGLVETRHQLDFKCPPKVVINTLGDFSDLYQGPFAEFAGQIKLFNLIPYDDGFLLQFPEEKHPDVLGAFIDNPKIFEIYKRYKAWGKQVDVTSAADINELILKGKINDFIDITETFQAQNYAQVAKQISERKNVKVVLIAGPSSSGKTTSAKKLALHLQALGYNPKVISLDNYYVGRTKNPKDENGNYDYECLEALDIQHLNENLNDLFSGKEIDVPSYNFDIGERYYTGEKMRLEDHDILIMEGIHGLNDKLTSKVKNEYKFKIYLSALTQLNLNDHNRLATSDNRLIRRIVRDSNYRGKSAADTIGMWESVQKGEKLHIFPFQNNADAVLNTALDYEIPVLKVYASPLLRAVKPTQAEYSEACRLLRFLDNFDLIPETYIPKQSIIREFIGGSSFRY
ncbi:nucleoside kinase [Treponema pectinovorum]|uniref:nucleoside kinase n=1 Tax=Treponema pectinovorum TaxID=164 RepID=UPI0011C9E441|nr:nucleoside kinase [Treponema pectinovorum]